MITPQPTTDNNETAGKLSFANEKTLGPSRPATALHFEREINLHMNSANLTPQTSSGAANSSGDRHHLGGQPPFPFELADPKDLDYWQANLRQVLEQATFTLISWLGETPLELEVWGPSSPLQEQLLALSSGHLQRGLLLRFPPTATLDAALLARIQKVKPQHLFLLHRVATVWDRLQSATSSKQLPCAIDPVALTRAIHLNLDLRLHRRRAFRRRNAALELSEFRHPPGSA